MNITVTLIGQMIAFIILIWFVNKVLWGPLSKIMNDRQARIADGLSAADKGKHELELAEKRAKDVLKDSKDKAADIITQAEKRANEIVEEAQNNAKVEAQRIVTAAQADIDRQLNQAKEQLRAQVSAIAVQGAGKVLGREVDANTHGDLLKDLATQI